MANWTSEKMIQFLAHVPSVLPSDDSADDFHQLQCKHHLEMFQTVLQLKENMAGRSKPGSSSQATDPFGQLSSASAMMLYIDVEQFPQEQDEAKKALEASERSLMGSIARSGLMFWGYPLRDFLPAKLPETATVQLKIRRAELVPIMDILVRGLFQLTKGRLLSCIPAGQYGEEHELWALEGQSLSDFDEEMLRTLLWGRPLMRYKELPEYLKVRKYAYLAVFAVSQQLEVFEQLPEELKTHDEVIEAAIVKGNNKVKDYLPASVLQKGNVQAMLMKHEVAENARKALLHAGSSQLLQVGLAKPSRRKPGSQEAKSSSQGWAGRGGRQWPEGWEGWEGWEQTDWKEKYWEEKDSSHW